MTNPTIQQQITDIIESRTYCDNDNFFSGSADAAEVIIKRHIEPLVKKNQELRALLVEAIPNISMLQAYCHAADVVDFDNPSDEFLQHDLNEWLDKALKLTQGESQ